MIDVGLGQFVDSSDEVLSPSGSGGRMTKPLPCTSFFARTSVSLPLR